jgi:hypothetical protein
MPTQCTVFVFGADLKRNTHTFTNTALIGFYNRNRLHCAVRPEYLNKLFRSNSVLQLGPALDQSVSRRPLTTDARVRSPDSPCEGCGARCCIGTDFSQGISIPPRQYYSSNDP